MSNASPGSGPGAEFDRSVHPIVASALAGISEAGRQAPATVENTFTVLDVALQANDELRSHIVALRNQASELRGELIEAKHEVRELKLIQESLRISTRGESGRDGARGVPGGDGLQGPIGPRGEPGPRGIAAPAVVEWRPDPEAFTVQAILADGSTGPMIALRSLFESYHNATSWVEDADLVEAARESRAQTDAEAEAAARWER